MPKGDASSPCWSPFLRCVFPKYLLSQITAALFFPRVLLGVLAPAPPPRRPASPPGMGGPRGGGLRPLLHGRGPRWLAQSEPDSRPFRSRAARPPLPAGQERGLPERGGSGLRRPQPGWLAAGCGRTRGHLCVRAVSPALSPRALTCKYSGVEPTRRQPPV